jgi:hypothetical protein
MSAMGSLATDAFCARAEQCPLLLHSDRFVDNLRMMRRAISDHMASQQNTTRTSLHFSEASK